MAQNNRAKEKAQSTSRHLAKVKGYRHMSNGPIESGDTLKGWELTDFNHDAEIFLDEVRKKTSHQLPSRIGAAFVCLPTNTVRRQEIPSFHDSYADLYSRLYAADIVDVNEQPTKLHVTDALVFSQFFSSYAAGWGQEQSAETTRLAERYWSNIPVGELEEAEMIVHPSSAVVITAQLEMPQAAQAEL